MKWDHFNTKWNLHCIKTKFRKTVKLLHTTSADKDLPKFVSKKWISDQPGEYYNLNKEIKMKDLMLRSNLCDFSDAYIVLKGDIIVTESNNAKSWNKFKNIRIHCQ